MDPRARLAALAGDDPDRASPAEAALWIAAEEYPGLDVPACLARLRELGDGAARRLASDLDVDGTVRALGRFLFEEQGFRGNAEDYYDPRNSFLNEVLDRRLGLPITLSVLYMDVAARAGVTARGIGLPGHFVVRVERHGLGRLVDPFHEGRGLDDADCRALVQRLSGGRLRLEAAHLRPVTTRDILVRMLTNLKGVYAARGDWSRAIAAVDRIVLLAPDAAGELRDRGQLHARAGRPAEAIRDWDAYLRRAPAAPDAGQVRAGLQALRRVQATLN